MTARPIDLVRDVLDHAVVDSEGMPCGMVDDIEIDAAPGGSVRPLRAVALLIGPGSWQQRLPRWAARIARRLVGDSIVRVPWSQVAKIGERIELSAPAAELGLGGADRRWSRLIARLPLS